MHARGWPGWAEPAKNKPLRKTQANDAYQGSLVHENTAKNSQIIIPTFESVVGHGLSVFFKLKALVGRLPRASQEYLKLVLPNSRMFWFQYLVILSIQSFYLSPHLFLYHFRLTVIEYVLYCICRSQLNGANGEHTGEDDMSGGASIWLGVNQLLFARDNLAFRFQAPLTINYEQLHNLLTALPWQTIDIGEQHEVRIVAGYQRDVSQEEYETDIERCQQSHPPTPGMTCSACLENCSLAVTMECGHHMCTICFQRMWLRRNHSDYGDLAFPVSQDDNVEPVDCPLCRSTCLKILVGLPWIRDSEFKRTCLMLVALYDDEFYSARYCRMRDFVLQSIVEAAYTAYAHRENARNRDYERAFDSWLTTEENGSHGEYTENNHHKPRPRKNGGKSNPMPGEDVMPRAPEVPSKENNWNNMTNQFSLPASFKRHRAAIDYYTSPIDRKYVTHNKDGQICGYAAPTMTWTLNILVTIGDKLVRVINANDCDELSGIEIKCGEYASMTLSELDVISVRPFIFKRYGLYSHLLNKPMSSHHFNRSSQVESSCCEEPFDSPEQSISKSESIEPPNVSPVQTGLCDGHVYAGKSGVVSLDPIVLKTQLMKFKMDIQYDAFCDSTHHHRPPLADNALAVSWENKFLLINPPWPLFPAVVEKLKQTKHICALVVAPDYNKPCYRELKMMAVDVHRATSPVFRYPNGDWIPRKQWDTMFYKIDTFNKIYPPKAAATNIALDTSNQFGCLDDEVAMDVPDDSQGSDNSEVFLPNKCDDKGVKSEKGKGGESVIIAYDNQPTEHSTHIDNAGSRNYVVLLPSIPSTLPRIPGYRSVCATHLLRHPPVSDQSKPVQAMPEPLAEFDFDGTLPPMAIPRLHLAKREFHDQVVQFLSHTHDTIVFTVFNPLIGLCPTYTTANCYRFQKEIPVQQVYTPGLVKTQINEQEKRTNILSHQQYEYEKIRARYVHSVDEREFLEQELVRFTQHMELKDQVESRNNEIRNYLNPNPSLGRLLGSCEKTMSGFYNIGLLMLSQVLPPKPDNVQLLDVPIFVPRPRPPKYIYPPKYVPPLAYHRKNVVAVQPPSTFGPGISVSSHFLPLLIKPGVPTSFTVDLSEVEVNLVSTIGHGTRPWTPLPKAQPITYANTAIPPSRYRMRLVIDNTDFDFNKMMLTSGTPHNIWKELVATYCKFANGTNTRITVQMMIICFTFRINQWLLKHKDVVNPWQITGCDLLFDRLLFPLDLQVLMTAVRYVFCPFYMRFHSDDDKLTRLFEGHFKNTMTDLTRKMWLNDALIGGITIKFREPKPLIATKETTKREQLIETTGTKNDDLLFSHLNKDQFGFNSFTIDVDDAEEDHETGEVNMIKVKKRVPLLYSSTVVDHVVVVPASTVTVVDELDEALGARFANEYRDVGGVRKWQGRFRRQQYQLGRYSCEGDCCLTIIDDDDDISLDLKFGQGFAVRDDGWSKWSDYMTLDRIFTGRMNFILVHKIPSTRSRDCLDLALTGHQGLVDNLPQLVFHRARTTLLLGSRLGKDSDAAITTATRQMNAELLDYYAKVGKPVNEESISVAVDAYVPVMAKIFRAQRERRVELTTDFLLRQWL